MLRRPINRHAILPALVLMLSAHLAAQPVCSTTAPDSIFFDHVTYNQYLPSSFSIDALVAFARSNQRFTVRPPATAFLADSLLPGDTVRTSFTLIVNPRSTSG